MKTMNNTVTLSGNLGSTVELTRLSTGKNVARVSIATNEFFRDKDGNPKKQTEWHNLVAWDSTAERMQRNLTKGSHVMIYGKLVNRPYIDRDGNTQYFSEVVVREFSWQKPVINTTQQSAA
jgi:single-strand DNA-binding protein